MNTFFKDPLTNPNRRFVKQSLKEKKEKHIQSVKKYKLKKKLGEIRLAEPMPYIYEEKSPISCSLVLFGRYAIKDLEGNAI